MAASSSTPNIRLALAQTYTSALPSILASDNVDAFLCILRNRFGIQDLITNYSLFIQLIESNAVKCARYFSSLPEFNKDDHFNRDHSGRVANHFAIINDESHRETVTILFYRDTSAECKTFVPPIDRQYTLANSLYRLILALFDATPPDASRYRLFVHLLSAWTEKVDMPIKRGHLVGILTHLTDELVTKGVAGDKKAYLHEFWTLVMTQVDQLTAVHLIKLEKENTHVPLCLLQFALKLITPSFTSFASATQPEVKNE